MDQPLTPFQTALAKTLHETETLFYVSLFFYGMAMWEFVSRVPAEIVRIYKPEFTKLQTNGLDAVASLPIVLVLINRICLPILVGFSLGFQRQPPAGFCGPLVNGAYSLLGITTCTCKAIEVIRVCGIRNSGTPLRVILWTATLLLFALWLTFANTQRMGEHPPFKSFPYASTCGPISHNGRWHISVWGSDLLFEVVILALTVDHAIGGFFSEQGPFGRHSLSMGQRMSLFSRITKQYYLGALLWFVLSVTVNLLQLIWFAVHVADIYAGLMVPIQIWLTTTMGPRLIVDMRMAQGHFSHFSVLGASRSSLNGSKPINAAASPQVHQGSHFRSHPTSSNSGKADSIEMVRDGASTTAGSMA